MLRRALGDLRAVLLARLGFGAGGSATGLNQTLLNSFLQNSQYQLYYAYDWRDLDIHSIVSAGADQTLIDYPEECNPDRILKIEALYQNTWLPMREGIETQHYTLSNYNERSYPQRFERRAQIEIWPRPDAVYTLRLRHIRALLPFSEDGHRATIDDELILLHAFVNAKLHYRQPDGQVYAGQLQQLLAKLKAKSQGNKRYLSEPELENWPRPVQV